MQNTIGKSLLLRPLLRGAGILLVGSMLIFAQDRVGTSQAAAQEKAPVSFTDQRTPVVLSDVERAFIRREMRGFLESLREILDASGSGDHAQVVAAARRSGMGGSEADHIPKSLASKLPQEFKKLGLATHRAFDQIARDAEKDGNAVSIPRRAGELMANCTACHGTWRIVGENP
jgi:hypothetical protein